MNNQNVRVTVTGVEKEALRVARYINRTMQNANVPVISRRLELCDGCECDDKLAATCCMDDWDGEVTLIVNGLPEEYHDSPEEDDNHPDFRLQKGKL